MDMWCRVMNSRLIPAYAGSTVRLPGWALGGWAHPRLRGEHCQPHRSARGIRGSSPLTRGAQGEVPDGLDFWGLIPAYAGSTEAFLGVEGISGAHPRLRGEHERLQLFPHA